MKRKQLIYGNCKVLAPDGELMFRCFEKRAYWYLDRNLATIEDDDPLTIRLTFEPNGRGQKEEHLKSIRENKCVVCGNNDLSVLTKHHLIPYEYRRYFPDELKSHNSSYVIPICVNCHENYEHNFAIHLKNKIAQEYNASKNGKTNERHHAEKYIIALMKHRNKMPSERIAHLHTLLIEAMADAGVNIDHNDLDDETLENYLEFFHSNDETVDNRHGKIVADKCKDLNAFSKRWVDHFIRSMKPQFMPDFLTALNRVS
jgi:exonuclease 3'-5' domain-containing protein 2